MTMEIEQRFGARCATLPNPYFVLRSPRSLRLAVISIAAWRFRQAATDCGDRRRRSDGNRAQPRSAFSAISAVPRDLDRSV